MENVVYYGQPISHSSKPIFPQGIRSNADKQKRDLDNTKLIYRNNIRDVISHSNGTYTNFSSQAGSLDRLLEAIPLGEKYELLNITSTPHHKHEFLLQAQIRIRVNGTAYHHLVVTFGACLDFSIMDPTPYTVDTFERAVPFIVEDSAKELLASLRTEPRFNKTTSALGYYKTPEGYCYHIVPLVITSTV